MAINTRSSAGRTYARLDDLHESPRNARVIPDDAVEMVQQSITKFGFRQPIVIDADGEIIVGHVRSRACRALGMKEVWVEIADDLTPEQVRAYRVADNRVAEFASWDTDALAKELEELSADDLPGFEPLELESMSKLLPSTDEDNEDEADEEEPTAVAMVRGSPVRGVPPAEGRPKLNMLTWMGGKARILNTIRGLIPTEGITCFVDAFGGGGSVTMNMGPYKSMIYNDIDGNVVNFFRCLRDRTDELKRALTLTPYARDEVVYARKRMAEGVDDPIEKARLFWVITNYSYRSIPKDQTEHTDRSWKGSPIRIGYGSTLKNKVDNIYEHAERWRAVAIDNLPALRVIRNFDSEKTFHFVDPPYVSVTRKDDQAHYKHEMTDADHEELGKVLNSINGRAMVCSYRSELYDRIFARWRRVDITHYSHTRAAYGTESFYLNYQNG